MKISMLCLIPFISETKQSTTNQKHMDSPIEMPEQEYGPGMIRETEATDSTFCDL